MKKQPQTIFSVKESVKEIAEALGGQRALARKLGIAYGTMSYYVQQNTFPARRMYQVRALAQARGITIPDKLFGMHPVDVP